MLVTKPEVNDGVALVSAGDVFMSLWNAPARLHRSRWVYDRADAFAALHPGGMLGLMVLLPAADLPDGATRAENSARLRKLAPSMRRLVTVVQGDHFRDTVVRSALRLMALPLDSGRLVVATTVEVGMSKLLKMAGPSTPSLGELCRAAESMYAALGLNYPEPQRSGAPN